MSVEILPTHTPRHFQAAVERACELLRRGEVVALPTETVYGLAANAWDESAVRRIYEVKGRPTSNPLIVHVADGQMAKLCSRDWPELATRLASRFWPGPLTLVVPKSDRISRAVTAGGDTVGIRWPFHPLMQAVIRGCGFPLAAPSANLANQLSPTCADHVRLGLGDRIPLIVDGGESNVGIESTVVDVTRMVPRILRPGMIGAHEIAEVAGDVERVGSRGGDIILRSPGMLEKHYSPRARLILRTWADEADLARQIEDLPGGSDGVWVIAHTQLPLSGKVANAVMIPAEAEAFARALYAELHRCDEAGARCIVVESVPDGCGWEGIADRLRRASSGG